MVASSSTPASDLGRRIAFGVVAVPITVALIYAGGIALAVMLAILGAVGTWELFRMARNSGVAPLTGIGVLYAAALPLAQAVAPPGVFSISPAACILAVLVVLVLGLAVRSAEEHPLAAIAITLFAPVYTSGTLVFGFAIRHHNYVVSHLSGTALVFFPVLLTWTNDIAAFAFGRSFGHQRLVPTVSPGKTVAGAVGGMVATVLVAYAYATWVLPSTAMLALPPGVAIAFGITVSIVAQIGDLFESLLKREAGVKDSSRLFPGHGGVLDRLDSLFFVLPVTYCIFAIPGLLIPTPG